MDLGATENPQSRIASLSCASCKERKQKCDKALPGCSRCERLLLKCHYAKASSIPNPPPSLNGSTISLKSHCDEVIDDTEALVQGLTGAATEDRSYCRRVSSLIETHKQQIDVMIETFYDSYHKWVPIVNRESLREYNNATRPDICRGFIALTLSMCLITRPSMKEGKEDRLRVALQVALKRLFWDPDSMAEPTLPLIQSGVLLSTFEFGQGLNDAAYITICTCLSMAQVSTLLSPTRGNQPVPLPAPGIWTRQDEAPRTWWAILIHERMISLKNGAPIHRLHFRTRAEVDNFTLPAELEDPSSISFYCEARSAVFLDQVLDLVRDSCNASSEKRLLFQAVDRNLLDFLKSLIEQCLGSCCEAVAIGLSAFIYLHHWRFTSTDPAFSAQDRLESSISVETAIKIIADTGTNAVSGDSQAFPCHSPYSIHLIYELLKHIRYLQQNGKKHLDNWATVLKMMLEHQKGRWKIADQYIAIFAEN